MIILGKYFSNILNRKKEYTAVLPENFNNKTKIVILLHGVGTDQNEWLENVPLQSYSEKFNVALFCPSGENSFYTDHLGGELFGECFGKEFLNVLAGIYKLEFSKSNVGIAGFSMGGYGALRLGLKYNDLYSYIGAFSPALIFYKEKRNDLHFNQVFSKGLWNTENDCLFLLKNLEELYLSIPIIRVRCGDTDPLAEHAKKFYESAISKNIDISYIESQGFHDFSVWNHDLIVFLEEFCKK